MSASLTRTFSETQGFEARIDLYNRFHLDISAFEAMETEERVAFCEWMIREVTDFEVGYAPFKSFKLLLEKLFSRPLSPKQRDSVELLLAERNGLKKSASSALREQFHRDLLEFLGPREPIDQATTADALRNVARDLFTLQKSYFEADLDRSMLTALFSLEYPDDYLSLMRTIMHRIRDIQEKAYTKQGFLLYRERPYSMSHHDPVYEDLGENITVMYGGSRHLMEAFLKGASDGRHFNDACPGLNAQDKCYPRIAKMVTHTQAHQCAIQHFGTPAVITFTLASKDVYYGQNRASMFTIFPEALITDLKWTDLEPKLHFPSFEAIHKRYDFEVAYQMHILFPLSNTYQYHSDSDEGYTTV